MSQSAVRDTWCKVRIVTPDLPGRPSETIELGNDAHYHHNDLSSVQVATGLAFGGSTFQLTFAPAHEGEPWAERIPPRSLVFIEMGSSWAPDDDPTVLVGRTGAPRFIESYQNAKYTRHEVITGEGIDSTLSTAKVWFSPYLEVHTKEMEAMLDRHLDPTLFEEAFIEALVGRAAWATKIWALNTDPREALLRVLNYYLLNVPTSAVNYLLPQGYEIKRLLRPWGYTDEDLDQAERLFVPENQKQKAHRLPPGWSILDERMRLPTASVNPRHSSVRDLIFQILDTALHEFFVRYERGQAHMIHRSKPFALPEELKNAPRFGSTRFTDPRDVPTLETIEIQASHLVGRSLTRGMMPFHNIWWVTPGQSALVNNEAFKATSPPVLSGKQTDHSFLGRFEMEPFEHQSPYLFIKNAKDPEQAEVLKDMSRKLGETLKGWQDPHPEMWMGQLQVLGRSSYRPGHRLLVRDPHEGPAMELYLKGASHLYNFEDGAWMCSLQADRGWRLDPGLNASAIDPERLV